MSIIEFATNDANTARKYLEKAGDVGPEVTSVLLDGVKNGICRVPVSYTHLTLPTNREV